MLGVDVSGAHRAYLGSILTSVGGQIVDAFKRSKIRVRYDSQSSNFIWQAPDDVKVTDSYWFAWKAFYPSTDIWQPSDTDLT